MWTSFTIATVVIKGRQSDHFYVQHFVQRYVKLIWLGRDNLASLWKLPHGGGSAHPLSVDWWDRGWRISCTQQASLCLGTFALSHWQWWTHIMFTTNSLWEGKHLNQSLVAVLFYCRGLTLLFLSSIQGCQYLDRVNTEIPLPKFCEYWKFFWTAIPMICGPEKNIHQYYSITNYSNIIYLPGIIQYLLVQFNLRSVT